MNPPIPTDLDYVSLLLGLKNFMKGDERFKDYDFEASGLNSIIKLLSANTNVSALSTYLSLNESFVSTSEILENIQALVTPQHGYVPIGKKSSTLITNIVVTPDDQMTAPASLTLPKTFTTLGLGESSSYTFTPLIERSTTLEGGSYTFNDVIMVEGQRITNTFYQDGAAIIDFVIPNKDVDISTIEVFVRVSRTDSTTTEFKRFESAFQLGKENQLFFLSMNRDGRYKITFGDDLFSKALVNGNVIYVTYCLSNGEKTNGISSLTATSQIQDYSQISLTVTKSSYGGSEREGIESIKTNSRFSQSSEGALTVAGEYERKLTELYPAYKVKAWGGDENTPPRQGYFLYATVPPLTEAEQEYTNQLLNKYSIGSIRTLYSQHSDFDVFVDISFASDTSKVSIERSKALIKSLAKTYFGEIEDFGASFDPRSLEEKLREIENVNRVYVSYSLQSPVQKTTKTLSFDYNHPIAQSQFYCKVTGSELFDEIKDTDSGFFFYKGGVRGSRATASVDYDLGTIVIGNLKTTSNLEVTENRAYPDTKDPFLTCKPYNFMNLELLSVEEL